MSRTPEETGSRPTTRETRKENICGHLREGGEAAVSVLQVVRGFSGMGKKDGKQVEGEDVELKVAMPSFSVTDLVASNRR